MKPTSSMYTLHILHGHNIGFQCLIFSLNSLRSLRCCSSWELVPKFLGPDKIGLHITKRSMLNWHSQMGWKGRDIDVKLKNTRWEKPLSIQRLMSTQSIDDMFLNLWSDCSTMSDKIFGKKNWNKKSPPSTPRINVDEWKRFAILLKLVSNTVQHWIGGRRGVRSDLTLKKDKKWALPIYFVRHCRYFFLYERLKIINCL